MRTGEILVEAGLIRDEDIGMALEIQRRHRKDNTPPLVGGIFCNWNMVTPLDLYLALDRHGKLMKIGDILVRQGKLMPTQLEQTLARQSISPKPFGKILVDAQVISDNDVHQALSVQANIPFARQDHVKCDKDQLATMAFFTGMDFIRVTGIVPVDFNDQTLTLALSRPSHMRALNDSMFGNVMYRIKCILVTRERHARLLSGVGRTGFAHNAHQERQDRGAFAYRAGPAMEALLVIHDPSKETLKLDALYHRYHALKGIYDNVADDAHMVLFKEFIQKRHGDIKRRFGCRHVAYQLEKNGRKVLIHAYPAYR